MVNLHILLFEVVLAVMGIMLLDYSSKAWRGWGYYGTAFLVITALYVVFILASALLFHHW